MGTLVKPLEEAPVRIELTNSRFAVCRLTTWPRRRTNKAIGSRAPRAIEQRICSLRIRRRRSAPARSSREQLTQLHCASRALVARSPLNDARVERHSSCSPSTPHRTRLQAQEPNRRLCRCQRSPAFSPESVSALRPGRLPEGCTRRASLRSDLQPLEPGPRLHRTQTSSRYQESIWSCRENVRARGRCALWWQDLLSALFLKSGREILDWCDSPRYLRVEGRHPPRTRVRLIPLDRLPENAVEEIVVRSILFFQHQLFRCFGHRAALRVLLIERHA